MKWREVEGKMKNVAEHSPAPTPSRAVYGFFIYLLAIAIFLLYLVWLLLPRPLLDQMGLDFLAQKYWAVALPIYLSVLFFTFVLIVYPSLGLLVQVDPSNPLDTDFVSRESVLRNGEIGQIPPAYDLPIE
eukprot:TRINITY_DN18090_c0_g1_i2.p1 TRINITY_DN18090_c0_g1~~TRINITY_DN18090_c0_g1_i2.p1  ORF type:complete len:130 (-),score=26.12 TRINITY_DN18090_c0_g1_i2:243-632(-)